MIRSIGVDLASIPRVRALIASQAQGFLDRLFTKDEQASCADKLDPAPQFAARLAAKEATMKALGAGTAEGVGWREIEVQGGGKTAPALSLSGGAAARADSLGITRLHLSLSHEGDSAIAFVVAEGTD